MCDGKKARKKRQGLPSFFLTWSFLHDMAVTSRSFKTVFQASLDSSAASQLEKVVLVLTMLIVTNICFSWSWDWISLNAPLNQSNRDHPSFWDPAFSGQGYSGWFNVIPTTLQQADYSTTPTSAWKWLARTRNLPFLHISKTDSLYKRMNFQPRR